MNFETYEREGHYAYAKLAETIANILSVIVRNVPNLRVQQIQHRAKRPSSLRTKLEQRRNLESACIEDEVKDLAGCRIVLYTNSDVTRFLSSGAIREIFNVDWERTKFHYPVNNDTAGGLFISYNYVVMLKEERLGLAEYAAFRGQWCEVQVQTTLDHAWSEMAHDTIYKPESLGFGTALMKDVENRMATIMRKYLLPAGFDFQKVANDVQQLRVGSELYSRGALKVLNDCGDNNERHNILNQFMEHVLPYYDNRGEMAPEIRACMISLVKSARKTEVTPIEYGFDGYTADAVIDLAFDVIDRLRYSHNEAIEATFETICELFPGAQSPDERNRIMQSAERLAENNLSVWQKAGPIVQRTLVSRISQLAPEALEPLRPVILEILSHVLEPDVSGTSTAYNSMTLHQGPVKASELLQHIRRDAIGELVRLFRSSRDDDERRAVIQALSNSTRLPSHGDTTPELLKIVLDDSIDVVRFYIAVADDQSLELLQTVEHNLLWVYRHTPKLPVRFEGDPRLCKAQEDLVQAVFAFRDKINGDRSFVIYKTLVGFQSVFPPAWEGDAFDTQGQATYRKREIGNLVKEITAQNAAQWFSIIHRCAQTKSGDGATFPSFRQFLEEFGRTKPDLLMQLVHHIDDELARFLPSMLKGLEGGALDADMRAYLRRWVDERRHLPEIASYCGASSMLDASLLEQCLAAAIEAQNGFAVLHAMDAAARRQTETLAPLARTVFLPGLRYFASKRDTRWIRALWPFSSNSSLLATLDEAVADEVLAGLVAEPNIDHETEEFLSILSTSFPTKVVDFFGERLRFAETPAVPKHYSAIPFSLDHLRVPLATMPDDLVQKVRTWFYDNAELFQYRGATLLSCVFPDYGKLEAPLRALVASGERRDIQFVLAVLKSYDGQPFLHATCQDIVGALAEDDPWLKELSIILDATGTVSGEFGLVEAYQRKRTEMQRWSQDPRKTVRVFADRHIRSLDRQIAADQRRSMEDLELRKRQYGVTDPGS